MAHTVHEEIAKEILLKMIEYDVIQPSQFPEAETTVDVICEAYKKILKAVSEG